MGNLPPSGVRPELYWNLTATLAYAVVLAVLIGLLKILLRVAKSRMLPRPKYVAVDSRFTKYDAGQNWSWDWCLAFPVRKEGSAAKNLKALSAPKQRRLEHYSMRFVVERLEAAGLETKLFRSRDRSVVFCKVRCSRTRLEEEAQRINYALPLAPSEVRSRIEAGGPRDALGAPSWYPRRNGWALPDRPDKSYDTEIRDEFHQSRLPYEAYAYARYDSKKQSAYSIRMPSNSQFTGVDRLKLIKSIMEADAKKRGAQLNIEELVEAGVLAAAYPLHADGELFSLMDRWIRFGKREVCDDAVKDYFGERIGMYFYFLTDHNRGLLRPAIVGVITHIIALFWVESRNVIVPIWAVYMSCWTTLYLENWKDREAWKAMEWGMSDFSITERARPKFEGREIHSPVTGLPELYFPARSSAKLRAWSYFLLFLALILAWLVFFAVYAMNSYLSTRPITHQMDRSDSVYDATGRYLCGNREPRGQRRVDGVERLKFDFHTGRYIGNILTQVIMASIMVLFGYAYSRLARTLNELENHKTESTFENHLIGKVFVVHLFVAFGPLLFIATIKDAVPYWIGSRRWGCAGGEGCFEDIQSLLAIIFCIRVLARNLADVLRPSLRELQRRSSEELDDGEYENPTDPAHMRRRQTSPTEEQYWKTRYHHILGPFDDYSELVVQFGYATLFAVAFPLAPLFAYVNSFVGLRTDAFKYCVDARRPWPTGCSSIGSWSLVLELTSYAATITSALLFAFTGDFLANRKLFSRFLLFIAYECLLVAVKVAYQLLRDTPPFEVKLQRKRVNFLGRKIVADEPDERKEDSDDESEEDEARHPLIVHDRDPEQNLEALRNPDAYRQNLA